MTAPADDELRFPPTLREVMLRPQSLGILAFCLLVAGVFAWLGQWQLARAIDFDPPEEGATEEIVPIDDVIAPGSYLDEQYGGQRVDVTGTWGAGDFVVVGSRFNDDVEGYWVTGRLQLADASSLAVAIGFTESRETADAAASALDAAVDPDDELALTGRVISDEGPIVPRTDPLTPARMSPAALLGIWEDVPGETYRVFLAVPTPDVGLADAGLEAIASPAPVLASPVNWLNVFYAVEWVVFAGFAFYLWYRLARDAQQREIEELEGLDPDEA